jgi:hypothetical protein
MKLKILLVAAVWTAVVSFFHVHLNIGAARFLSHVRATLGIERQRVYVGFLPVT